MIALKPLYNAALLTLTVCTAAAFAQPALTVTPASSVINYTVGAAAPAGQTVTLSTTDAGTAMVTGASINYFSGPSTGWLSVFPPLSPGNALSVSTANPATLTLFLSNPTTLVAGSYTASINLTYSGASTAGDTFAVFLVVTGGTGGGGMPGETITTAPTSLSFSYSPGGSLPAVQTITATVSDGAGFGITAITNDGNPWLTAAAGTAANTVSVSVNPAILNAGTYTGTVTLTAPFAVAQVPVTLTVGGNGLTANPASISFTVPQNYGFGAPVSVQVTSTTPAAISAFGQADSNWLVVDTPAATTPATIVVRANDSSLPQGTYSGTLTVQTSPSNQLPIPVTLTVGPPAVLQLSPASLNFSYTVGNPLPASQTTTVKSITGSAQSFTVTSSTTDGAAWLMAAPVSPTPGQVVTSVNPGILTPGTYTGVITVTPSATGASPQPITVSLTVSPPPTPVVKAVLSSASYQGGSLAPGEFVTLFGANLGPAALTVAPAGTFPKTLGLTTVMFDGILAPVLYASATQTSVQVPYGIQIGNTVLTVQRIGAISSPMAIASVPALPGFFTVDTSGRGPIAAINQDGTLNSPSNPALRGSIVSLYGTGEGITTPASVEGAITPSTQPFPQTTLASSVTFSGAPATIKYLGETPTVVSGLFQLSVVVPSNAPTGPVSVVLNINGQSSPGGATIAVQ